jgi:DNA-binding response OmpR family regulator
MRLLIVEDDTALCELLQEHFAKKFDCKVLTAATAREALQLLEAEQPEGMLLDINLGTRLSGFDVLARTPEISPGTKVIIVTADDDLGNIEKAREMGAVDYVTKPFTVGYLEDTVAAKIAKHLICA